MYEEYDWRAIAGRIFYPAGNILIWSNAQSGGDPIFTLGIGRVVNLFRSILGD